MSDLRMPDLNRVSLAGRLTRDPELQYIQSGTALCKLGLAVSKKFKTKSGETREDTVFINITAWGPTAEYCNEYMKKGAPVMVEGRLTMSEWEDKNTGQKRTAIEVTAERIQNMVWEDRGNNQGGGNQGGGYNQNQGGGNQGGGGGQGGYNQGGGQNQNQGGNAPQPRHIEEPIPEDDIPF